MIKDYDQLVKLVLVGSSGVGKSSILVQFADNKFNEGYFTTIGVDFRLPINLTQVQDSQHRRQKHKIPDLGHCWAGALQNNHLGLLQRC